MRVTNNNSVNIDFSAKYLSSTYIQKYSPQDKKYKQYKVSFILFEPWLKADLDCLHQISETWQNSLFVKRICGIIAESIAQRGEYGAHKIYGLTYQEMGVYSPEPDKILGIASTIDELHNTACLDKLEVNPKYRGGKNEFKGAGSGILKSLKKIYRRIWLFSVDDPKVKEFYRKNNFTEYIGNSGLFNWYKK